MIVRGYEGRNREDLMLVKSNCTLTEANSVWKLWVDVLEWKIQIQMWANLSDFAILSSSNTLNFRFFFSVCYFELGENEDIYFNVCFPLNSSCTNIMLLGIHPVRTGETLESLAAWLIWTFLCKNRNVLYSDLHSRRCVCKLQPVGYDWKKVCSHTVSLLFVASLSPWDSCFWYLRKANHSFWVTIPNTHADLQNCFLCPSLDNMGWHRNHWLRFSAF